MGKGLRPKEKACLLITAFRLTIDFKVGELAQARLVWLISTWEAEAGGFSRSWRLVWHKL